MEAVQLKVLKTYRSRDLNYQAGTVIEVRRDDAEFLLRDAPGCFAPVVVIEVLQRDEPPVVDDEKAPDEPVVDKMIRREDSRRK